MRVKICGITSVEDAVLASKAGADAIGLVFYEPSPRNVDIKTALEISRAAGPFVTLVGLFVNETADRIRSILNEIPLNLLQFHGDETPEFCEQFSRPYIKAIRMKPDINVDSEIAHYPKASGILLDAYKKGVPGGTGAAFDWQRVPAASSKHIILAGGLNPDNVSLAISQTKPYAVDVSGGVESKPGIKDEKKVIAFINNSK